MKVLLIFDVVPEQSFKVLLEDPSPEEMMALEFAHGRYINSDEANLQMEQVEAAVLGDADGSDRVGAWSHFWQHRIIDPKSRGPLIGEVDRVYWSGVQL